jgi:hypothetical protein
MRSAKPSGGLLSDGDPAPVEARDFHTAVNKEWDAGSPSGPSQLANHVEPRALVGREPVPDPLVVIHGPGGFPLMGAIAIGHRHRQRATGVVDFASPSAIGERDPQIATELAERWVPASSEIVVTDGSDAPESRRRPGRRWEALPVSIFSGLGLATVFTLNAVLSQPIAGFDFLAARLYGSCPRQSKGKGPVPKPATPVEGS